MGRYSGDLNVITAFNGDRFYEKQRPLFETLPEDWQTMTGVPNPKKSCIGRVLSEQASSGLRCCFLGAHFPVGDLKKVLALNWSGTKYQAPTGDVMDKAKDIYKQILNRILKAADSELEGGIDDETIIFLQGDLNSRTIVDGENVYDILREVVKEDRWQQGGLRAGRWHELAPSEATTLPVTYKFEAKTVPTAEEGERLSLGMLFERKPIQAEWYDTRRFRQMLLDKGEDFVDKWCIKFRKDGKKKPLKVVLGFAPDEDPFHFPAFTDRVIYWAPESLSKRLSWEVLGSGYEVNYSQMGSDHKPVTLEAVLKIEKRELPQ